MHVAWGDDAQSVIIATGEKGWTWDDFHTALNEIIIMVSKTSERVDLIYAQGPGSRVPQGSGMPHYRRAMRVLPKNVNMHILLNDTLIVRSVLNILLKLYGKGLESRFAVARDLDDAYKIIHKDREQEAALIVNEGCRLDTRQT
jgi:hypothetical protein